MRATAVTAPTIAFAIAAHLGIASYATGQVFYLRLILSLEAFKADNIIAPTLLTLADRPATTLRRTRGTPQICNLHTHTGRSQRTEYYPGARLPALF